MTIVGELVEEFKETVGDRDEPLILTLTEKNGFVPQAERFNKRLATENVEKYKVFHGNDLAFNPYLLWAGAVAQNTICDEGAIRPLYPTFRVRPGFDPRYVGRLLLTPSIVLRYDSIAFGSVPRRRRSSVPDFLALEVPDPPPIEEQRRIAAVMDAADALRAKRREALAKLDTLTQAIFIDTFGDDPSLGTDAVLEDHLRADDRLDYGVVQPGEDVPNGCPLIRVGDLVGGRVAHDNITRISPDIDAKYARSRRRGDEVLISCVGSTGVVALASPAEAGWNIARAVARVPLRGDVSREFVATALRLPATQRYFEDELRTVSQPTLNIKQIKGAPLGLPTPAAQASFTQRVTEVRVAIRRAQSSQGRLDSLFSSIQQRAFRGEL